MAQLPASDLPPVQNKLNIEQAFQYALSAHQAGRISEAEMVYGRILAALPGHVGALHYLGVCRLQQRDYAGALTHMDAALAQRPDYAEAHSNRGNVLQAMGRCEESLASFDRALACQPSAADAWFNRSNALKELGRFDEALTSVDRAIALQPSFAQAHCNHGNLCQVLGQFAQALVSFERAVALRPDYAEAQWNSAYTHLLLGDLAMGLPLLEWRWRARNRSADDRHQEIPLWLGQTDLAGKTILLYAEQGYGDTLQFCRYASLLAARGAKVVLEVQPSLKSLLASLAGAPAVLATGERLPAVDYRCPLLSLPLAMHTDADTIPGGVPYLGVDPALAAAWQAKLGARRAPLRIGLAWSGSGAHENDRNRSLSLAMLLAAFDGADVECFSLQKDVRADDRAALEADDRIRHFGDELRDFADTAALVAAMDLVISVDTSVAHLAGALAKPVWLLLPFPPDWRWLLDRDDSPWYPTARLFRQPHHGDWATPLRRVADALPSAAST